MQIQVRFNLCGQKSSPQHLKIVWFSRIIEHQRKKNLSREFGQIKKFFFFDKIQKSEKFWASDKKAKSPQTRKKNRVDEIWISLVCWRETQKRRKNNSPLDSNPSPLAHASIEAWCQLNVCNGFFATPLVCLQTSPIWASPGMNIDCQAPIEMTTMTNWSNLASFWGLAWEMKHNDVVQLKTF